MTASVAIGESFKTEATVRLPSGVQISFVEKGTGVPLVFVHGTTGDYSTWDAEVEHFAGSYRAIAYSRRYNDPNKNEVLDGHSAIIEASDLDQFLAAIDASKVHLVGHSYGGYTSLVLAVEHPERIASLTLCEPPVFSWLNDLPGDLDRKGPACWTRFHERCVAPTRQAALTGDSRDVVRCFIDGLTEDGGFDRLPRSAQERIQRNAKEVVALFRSDNTFPPVDRDRVAGLRVPVLVMSGEQTSLRSKLVDAELIRLLPKETTRRAVIREAGHAMWAQQPRRARKALASFLADIDEAN